MQSTCDTFEDLSLHTAQATAAAIAARGVEVLLDYDGMHEFNNQVAIGMKPCRVQVRNFCHYLRLAGTPPL